MGRKNQRRVAARQPGRRPGSEEDTRRQGPPGGDTPIDERDDFRESLEDDAPRGHEAEPEARPPFSDRERGDEESGRPLKLDR